MIAEFELVGFTATSATLSFHVPDIASAFLNDVDLADARPGRTVHRRHGHAVTPWRAGALRETADARLQFSVDDTNTGLTYDYDLTTTPPPRSPPSDRRPARSHHLRCADCDGSSVDTEGSQAASCTPGIDIGWRSADVGSVRSAAPVGTKGTPSPALAGG